MVDPHNSGSAVRIFLKFCAMKGADRQMKMILIVFSKKKYLFWVNGPFWVKRFGPMVHPHNSGSAVRIVIKFCTMKRANR